MKPREDLEKIFERISKTFTFEDAHLELSSDKRMDAIIKFASEEFAPDEPLGRSLQLEYDEQLKQMLRHVLSSDHLSVLLVSDSTDEIIAVRVSYILKKSDNFEEEVKKLNNTKLITINTFLSHKDKELNVYDKYGVEEYIHFLMLGVDRRHRRKGLASKMMDVAVQFYSEIGMDPCIVKGEGTSNFSQRIYNKFEFDLLHEMPYDEYKVDGEVVFKNMGEHKSSKVYAKQLYPKQ